MKDSLLKLFIRLAFQNKSENKKKKPHTKSSHLSYLWMTPSDLNWNANIVKMFQQTQMFF